MDPIVFEKYYAKFKSNKLKFPSPSKVPSINEFDFLDDDNAIFSAERPLDYFFAGNYSARILN
jgi:hypothetical protein